jgi:hypothetical protein
MDEESGDDPRPTKRARKSMSATRSNVATLIGLQSVTGRSIAYVAVQVRIFFDYVVIPIRLSYLYAMLLSAPLCLL